MILRNDQVCQETGLSRTTIWRLERAGKFPQRVRLGPGAVGWVAHEVYSWIESRPRGMAASQAMPAGISAQQAAS